MWEEMRHLIYVTANLCNQGVNSLNLFREFEKSINGPGNSQIP